MSDEAQAPNTVSAVGAARSRTPGDVPESLRRRYYVDERGGQGLGFYVDATVKAPAFRDRGRQLVALRTDPNAIRDMMAIARHRGWTVVVARGSADFRREAWLVGRAAGLEVRGYRPSERDLQELERKTTRGREAREPAAASRGERGLDAGAQSRLAFVEAVVRRRLKDCDAQDRLVSRARARFTEWLARGARFDILPARRERATAEWQRAGDRDR